MTNKNILFFSLSFFIVLLVSLASAAYTVDEVLTDDFSFTEYSNGELKEFVYLVAPENYPTLSVELQGHGAYEPVLYVYDVSEEKFSYQGEAGRDEKIKYSFVPEAGDKNLLKEYYIIILSNGKDGSSFDFSFHITPQNDAELGMDASKRFTDANIIEPGSYTANLGGGDEKDYYALKIEQDETFTISLVSLKEERLGFELIESNYMTTLSDKGGIKGINRTFTSTSDQTIWIGIEGSTPYTFSITSNKATKENRELESLPPLPPMPPTPKEVMVITQEQEEGEPMSTNTLIILLLIVVGIGLATLQFFRAKKVREQASKKKKK